LIGRGGVKTIGQIVMLSRRVLLQLSTRQVRLVSSSPLGLTNDPEPPSLNRTLGSRRWSSHACVGTKFYSALSSFSGGLSKVLMPSSA
jgi:hypothetical protein